MAKLIEWAGMMVFIASAYLLVLWVTASFVHTHNGPIRWAVGWEETKEFIGADDE